MSWGRFQSFFFVNHDVAAAAAPADLVVLSTLDNAYRGEPFVAGSPSSSIDLGTLDYVYRGQPLAWLVP